MRDKVDLAALLRNVGGFSLANAILAGAAAAQVAPPAAPPGPVAAAAPQAEAAPEEIIVTAQRRQERLQNVPISMNAFSATEIKSLNLKTTKDLTLVTPGLNFTQSVYSPQPTIRGVGSRGVGAGEESEVPLYIDGVYQSFLPGAIMEFNDVDRIEVLKGPQGALLGRNATGGAINIITRTPTADPHLDLDVSYGRFNQWIAKGYVSGGTDKVAGELAFVIDRDDGYIHDLVRDARYGVTRNESVRGKVVITPDDRFDLKLAASYTHDDESVSEAYRNLDGNTIARSVPGTVIATQPYTAALNFAPFNRIDQWSVSATARYRLDSFDVTGITSYQHNDFNLGADADATRLPLITYFLKQFSRNTYNEIYATSKTDSRLSWIGGFVYYHDNSGNPYLDIGLNIPGVLVGDLLTSDRIRTNSYAVYAQASYKLTDALTATVGGRYTTETKSINNSNGVEQYPASFVALSNRATFRKFTPNGTLQYQPSSTINIYAKAGQAFKSGVFNPTATSAAAIAPIRPETLTQYELGTKIIASRLLQFTVAGYYTDYKNLQSGTRTPTGESVIQNAGRAHIYGMEAQANLHPASNLNLFAGVAALHGTYSDYTDADVYFPITTVPAAQPCTRGGGTLVGGNKEESCNVNGKDIIRTPKVTANAGGDFTAPTSIGDLILSTNLYYQGVSYWDAANQFEEKPYVVLNARLSLLTLDKRIRASIWGNNLTGSQYSVTELIGSNGTAQVLAKPRTLGVELEYSF